MMTQNADKKRDQLQIFCMDDLVPQDHLLRLIDKAIDWNIIYDLVEDTYSSDTGRPSMNLKKLAKMKEKLRLFNQEAHHLLTKINENICFERKTVPGFAS
jgi:transposase